jgi:D-arabinose 1-dehydrogenase-like Zn-dependent alcohol dehydrogenase
MKAMVVRKANGNFEPEEREIPDPRSGEIRVKVEACGICHSDAFIKFGALGPQGAGAGAQPLDRRRRGQP